MDYIQDPESSRPNSSFSPPIPGTTWKLQGSAEQMLAWEGGLRSL